MFTQVWYKRQGILSTLYRQFSVEINNQRVFVYNVKNHNMPYLHRKALRFENIDNNSLIKSKCRKNDIIFGYSNNNFNRNHKRFLFAAKITKIIDEDDTIFVSGKNKFTTFFYLNDINKFLQKNKLYNKPIIEALENPAKRLNDDNLINLYNDIMKYDQFQFEDMINTTVFIFRSSPSISISIKNKKLLIPHQKNQIKMESKINDLILCFGPNDEILYIAEITHIMEKNGERQLLSDNFKTSITSLDSKKYLKSYDLINKYLLNQSQKLFMSKFENGDVNFQLINLFDDIMEGIKSKQNKALIRMVEKELNNVSWKKNFGRNNARNIKNDEYCLSMTIGDIKYQIDSIHCLEIQSVVRTLKEHWLW